MEATLTRREMEQTQDSQNGTGFLDGIRARYASAVKPSLEGKPRAERQGFETGWSVAEAYQRRWRGMSAERALELAKVEYNLGS